MSLQHYCWLFFLIFANLKYLAWLPLNLTQVLKWLSESLLNERKPSNYHWSTVNIFKFQLLEPFWSWAGDLLVRVHWWFGPQADQRARNPGKTILAFSAKVLICHVYLGKKSFWNIQWRFEILTSLYFEWISPFGILAKADLILLAQVVHSRKL